jgi:ferredoxin
MRVLICYFSGSGNTKLACDYIAGKIRGAEFEFFNICENKTPDFGPYDVVGFAAFADFWGPSPKFKAFISSLPACPGKPAFVFNTFGMFNGATLRVMRDMVTQKGFRVFAGHALHMPENIPTMIVAGMANEQAPNDREMAGLNGFIGLLSNYFSSPESLSRSKPMKVPFRDRLFPEVPRFVGKWGMGPKFVDIGLCTKCGKCVKVCPYGAIRMAELPVFEEKKCMTCWACYNHCPTRAIYTKKFRDKGHYPAPIAAVRDKLRVQ